MNWRKLAALALMVTAYSAEARAHGIAGAFVSIESHGERRAEVLVKLPITEGAPTDLGLRFPEGCRETSAPSRARRPASVLKRWVVECDSPLTGMEIEVIGLNAIVGEAFVEFRSPELSEWNTVVRRGETSLRLGQEDLRGLESSRGYFRLGVEHILSGLDHLLFLLALFLVVVRTRAPDGRRSLARGMFATVTAFTIGHSITLAAATLDVVGLPQGPSEFVIAMSVLLLAVELAREDETTLTMRFPWVVAFAFGLLHGFGFAGALAEIGLPASGIAQSLLLFNLGVEFGQLLVVLAATAALLTAKALGTSRRNTATLDRALVYGVGVLSAYWCFQRSLGWLL